MAKGHSVVYEVESTREAIDKVYKRLVEDHQVGFEVGLTNMATKPPMHLVVCMAIAPDEHAAEIAEKIGDAVSVIMDSFFEVKQ